MPTDDHNKTVFSPAGVSASVGSGLAQRSSPFDFISAEIDRSARRLVGTLRGLAVAVEAEKRRHDTS
jgi:hypothetical protein